MKITRLCGLVVLAVVAVLIFSVPAQALDHPWDGTKLVDTTNISSTNGSNDSNNGGSDDGGGVAPRSAWYSVFVGWITDIFSNDQADETNQVLDSKAVKNSTEGKEESLSKLQRR
jgi:hypothetical protein